MRAAPAVAGMKHNGIRTIMDPAMSGTRPDLIRLEIGEPGFPTPAHVVRAADEAAAAGRTKYTANAGIPELRAALSDKIKRVNGFDARPEDIVVTAGGVQALFATLTALVEPGDDILIPDPAWPNYIAFGKILGASTTAYSLAPESGFLPDLAELERLVTPRTKVLMLNSPSNPVGSVFPAGTLAELIAFAERNDLWIVSDECYDQVVFDDTFASTAAVGGAERTISVFTFSKTYAMTGWRIGYLAAPPSLAEIITRLQEPMVSCISTPGQYAARAALTGPQDEQRAMVATYRANRDLAVGEFAAHGFDVYRTQGAFYLWMRTGNRDLDGMEIAKRLITEHGVAVGPGPAFGERSGEYIRLSLAASADDLGEGIRRICASGLLHPAGRF
ncbi:aminotransferase class I/II-fold pyridoxal phosphate-dependent enzyme [Nonomuraea sp. NPDC003709]|uniref:pyridoxal phosphate-dependent aminotransferase n=1 Tax=Nonomuraea sp. NPDC003709 TaxID=3154450 RepID=UPI0033AC4BA0